MEELKRGQRTWQLANSYIFLFNSYYNAPLPLLTPSDLPNHDEATQKLLASLLLHDIREGLPSPMAPPGHARSHQPMPPIGLATGPPIPMSIDDIKRNTESFHSVFSGGDMYINGYVREYTGQTIITGMLSHSWLEQGNLH
jgi:hypothetical protein